MSIILHESENYYQLVVAIYSIGLNYHRYVSVTWVYIPLLQQFLFQKFDSITVDVKALSPYEQGFGKQRFME